MAAKQMHNQQPGPEVADIAVRGAGRWPNSVLFQSSYRDGGHVRARQYTFYASSVQN